jgi:hypothetical protein
MQNQRIKRNKTNMTKFPSPLFVQISDARAPKGNNSLHRLPPEWPKSN